MDEATLQMLTAAADRGAIENVLGRYCRAIDRLDLELLRSVYHPDAFDDHGAMKLKAHEFAEQIIATLRDVCVYSMHTVTHAVIDIEDKQACSEAYYLGYHTIAAGGEAVEKFFGKQYFEAQRRVANLERRHEYICGGRYLDRLEKRDGIWRIADRKITNEWGVCRPEATLTEGMPAAFLTPGSRDRDDPVYRLAFG